jgi:hypothetical protein
MTTRRHMNASAVLDAVPALDMLTDDELHRRNGAALCDGRTEDATAIKAEIRRRAEDKLDAQDVADEQQRREQERQALALREQRDAGRRAYEEAGRAVRARVLKIEELVTGLIIEVQAFKRDTDRAYGAAHDAGFVVSAIVRRPSRLVTCIAHQLVLDLELQMSGIDLSNDGNRWRRDEQGRWRPLVDIMELPALPPIGTEEH